MITIALSTGRGEAEGLRILKSYGLRVQKFSENRNMKWKVQNCGWVTIISVKPSDLASTIVGGLADIGVGYSDVIIGQKDHIRVVQEFDHQSDHPSRICLVGKKGLNHLDRPLKCASEYPTLKPQKYTIKNTIPISGSAEGWVLADKTNVCITVVQTGTTLETNGLEIYEVLTHIKPVLFISRQRWSPELRMFMLEFIKPPIYIDGVDGSGKTTLYNKILESGYTNVYDRSLLTDLTLKYQDDMPETIPFGIFIVLDVNPETALQRIKNRTEKEPDKWETPEKLYYFRHKYRMLAMRYGLYFIDTTNLSIDQVLTEAYFNRETYLLPRIDRMPREAIETLEIVNEGESKIIRKLTNSYDIVEYKPTIYSHKMQRPGVIPDSAACRMSMSRAMLELLWMNEINHSYCYVGDKYIMVEHIDNKDIPPIEVVAKAYYTGTDKHRYFHLERFGIVEQVDDNTWKYFAPYIRFDMRNPNHDPETGNPWGDYCMANGLANQLINVNEAEKNALKTFKVLRSFFNKHGFEMMDICFMFTKDGKKMYYEISQDCARIKKLDLSDQYDKDIWRRGGSSDQIIEKWRQIADFAISAIKQEIKHYCA